MNMTATVDDITDTTHTLHLNSLRRLVRNIMRQTEHNSYEEHYYSLQGAKSFSPHIIFHNFAAWFHTGTSQTLIEFTCLCASSINELKHITAQPTFLFVLSCASPPVIDTFLFA